MREIVLHGMSDVQKKRAKQLAFVLMMHTKNRAIQKITGLSDPVNGLEIWRRFLAKWEPVNRDRSDANAAMSSHRKQKVKSWRSRNDLCGNLSAEETLNLGQRVYSSLAHST